VNPAIAAVEAVAGTLLLLVTFYDMFQSVVLPRPAVHKVQLARLVVAPMWRVWRWAGARGSRIDRSEARLAAFGPVSLLTLFLIWALALVSAYGLIVDALRDQFKPPLENLAEAIYVSATTLVPLAYGDVVPEQGPARFLLIIESATGVALAALAITLLFELYGSFRTREEAVVALDAVAGAPPSAVQLLETTAEPGMDDELEETFDEWRHWAAMVLESHLAYPLLIYFRSSHDNEAWINSLAAVMDAAALIVSSTDNRAKGAARLMLTVGDHLVEDLAWVFRLHVEAVPIMERHEYRAALERMRKAGYEVTDGDASWDKFVHLRSKYASALNQMAQWLLAPPAQWVGDRSYLPHRQRRRRRQAARTH
jgi:hypothetical protein